MATLRGMDDREKSQLDITNWLIHLFEGRVQLTDMDFDTGGCMVLGKQQDCQQFGMILNKLADEVEIRLSENKSYGG